MLLPLLAVIATGDDARIEQALSDGVRARVEQGWAVADVRTVSDEIVVTLARGDAFERHVVHFAQVDTYSVEPATTAPAGLEEPSSFLAAAIAAPAGGLELESGCGEYYVRPYLIDEHATGAFATELVARTLGTADNLAHASPGSGTIRFSVTRRRQTRELVVWLDPKGAVLEAQLRRFEYGDGGSTYKRMPALKKALAHGRVVAIRGTTLILPRASFALDPDGEAFGFDPGEHDCGC